MKSSEVKLEILSQFFCHENDSTANEYHLNTELCPRNIQSLKNTVESISILKKTKQYLEQKNI